ncbi:9213_t:CDS:2 [Acaulospora morrowiae]|uniref:9213_t:CDS:1 n=1 Tax=Acaulospora morrowiae TaxID=94023 RepID=A0A9N9APD1_9GLOM|nr:9213_t:CDS:2 [Acaulospora morrowiae]
MTTYVIKTDSFEDSNDSLFSYDARRLKEKNDAIEVTDSGSLVKLMQGLQGQAMF